MFWFLNVICGFTKMCYEEKWVSLLYVCCWVLLSTYCFRTLIKGDKRGGFTLFWADDGLDTGPILLQRECDVDPNDTVDTLYNRFMYPEGIRATVSWLAIALLEVFLIVSWVNFTQLWTSHITLHWMWHFIRMLILYLMWSLIVEQISFIQNVFALPAQLQIYHFV